MIMSVVTWKWKYNHLDNVESTGYQMVFHNFSQFDIVPFPYEKSVVCYTRIEKASQNKSVPQTSQNPFEMIEAHPPNAVLHMNQSC